MAGWEALGNVLGGGIDREGKYQEGRYRSAQTEAALATARENQMKATQDEKLLQLQQDWTAAPPDFTNPSNSLVAQLIGNKLGSDFSATQTGVHTGQDTRLRGVAADPASSALVRQRALQAVEGKPSSDLVTVGAHDYTNLTAEDPTTMPLAGALLGEETNHSKDYKTLVGLGAPPGPDTFGRVLRADQVLNAGGVPTVRTTGTGAVTTPVDTETVAGNAKAIAGAKTEGIGLAKRTLDLPAAKSRLASMDYNMDSLAKGAQDLIDNPELWAGIGPTQVLAKIPGSAGANIRAKINTLNSKLALDTLTDLRNSSKTGGALGNVSDKEGELLKSKIASLDANLSAADFRRNLQDVIDYTHGLKSRTHAAFDETYPELKVAAPAAAGGAAPSFATEAEAEAAQLTPGTRVTIGGVSGTWQ